MTENVLAQGASENKAGYRARKGNRWQNRSSAATFPDAKNEEILRSDKG